MNLKLQIGLTEKGYVNRWKAPTKLIRAEDLKLMTAPEFEAEKGTMDLAPRPVQIEIPREQDE